MGGGTTRHYLPKGSILLRLGRQGLGSNGWCFTSQGTNPCVLWVALGTGIPFFFYFHKFGKETQNLIVEALAYDHRNDIWSASATSVGIFLSQPGVPWVDPLASTLVALLILCTGIFILRESSVQYFTVRK
jgi:divalent metal cation (Fe/Co/Zn/Cd) transporter